jgi:hypothetical protein
VLANLDAARDRGFGNEFIARKGAKDAKECAKMTLKLLIFFAVFLCVLCGLARNVFNSRQPALDGSVAPR